MIKSFSKGFTLVEILVSVAILAFFLCGLLATYLNMFFLSDLTRDFTLATNVVQAKIEEAKKKDFDSLSSFNEAFDSRGFSESDASYEATLKKGIVKIEINSTGYSDLKMARITACFQSRGRIIGEDKNLNGSLDSAEDINHNNRLDSPSELVALIAR